jgi:hypothetical protein
MTEPVLEPLLAELRSVLQRADPVPAEVVAAAKGSFTWRTVDAELAELVADSLTMSAPVRGVGAPRLLTFEGAALVVEVEVAETGTTRRLLGQLVPTAPADIVVRWQGGSAATTADDLGRFAVADIPAGPVSISVTRPSDPNPVVTSWVTV